MKISKIRQAKEFFNQMEKGRRKKWAVCLSAAAVLFVTIYALVLPAITMEGPTYCGKDEHVHSDACYEKVLVCKKGTKDGASLDCPLPVHKHTKSCYNSKKELTCGYADYTVHEHDKNCYADGKLICTLKEAKEHKHDASCYEQEKTLVCGKEESEGHTHSDKCYTEKKELVCKKEESEGHKHGEGCYDEEGNLICEKEESEGHKHGDDCYKVTKELTCGKEESEGHKHSDKCYEVKDVLKCKKDEVIVHVHDQSCFNKKDHTHTDECKNADGVITCGGLKCDRTEVRKHQHSADEIIPASDHEHTDACYEKVLTCTKEEHEHTDVCYSETKTVAAMEETKKEAKEHNFLATTEDGDMDSQDDADAQDGAAENAESAEAKNGNTENDTVNIEETEAAGPDTICGKEVHEHTEDCYANDGDLICGKRAHEHSDACYEGKKTFKDDTVKITAVYDKAANLPEEAELKAYPVTEKSDPEHYAQRQKEAMSAADRKGGSAEGAIIYNIGFYVDGEEVEPESAVKITVQFLDENGFAAGDPVTVVHFGEDGAEVIGDTKVDKDRNASFTSDEFSEFAFFSGDEDSQTEKDKSDANDNSDLEVFLTKAEITDANGNPLEDGKLYVGENYAIHLEFTEGGPQGKQFTPTEDGTLTYRIPKNFSVEPGAGMELTVTIDGKDVKIGTYSIDENGLLTITLTEEGKDALNRASNVSLAFDMDATAQAVEGGGDGKVHFGDTGQEFDFEIVDQARVEVDKQGKYTENADKRGGKLEYTVTTTVKRGSVSDLSILDEFTPPNTSALKVEDVDLDAIKVTIKRHMADGTDSEVELKKGVDYELVEAPDVDHPGKKTFQVKLKEDSAYYTLNEGDELVVTYPYEVEYVSGSTDVFWGNVVNDVHVTGKGKAPAPADDPEKVMPEIDIDEHKGSNVEIQVTPPGDGIIFKTQEFSEADHKLHYTLYTVVPKGTWKPFFIQDDMVVEFGGEKYNLQEFKEDGRVSNLQVSAVDVGEGKLGNWSDSTGEQRRQSLEELKENAHKLTGYDMYHVWNNSPAGYDPASVENCIRLWNNNNLFIIFGEWKYGQTSLYGNWDYPKDRLIITEYDLDMSNDRGPLTLVNMSDYQTTMEKSASEVLLAGIMNTVHMRFDGYNPGYAVFFNNADRMNKTGVPNKNDNTITWTVTMNTTDTTVNKYFRDVAANLHSSVKDDWSDGWYNKTMQAVFYDVLPDGWEYVPGTLAATTIDKYNIEQYFPFNSGEKYSYSESQENGKIIAPLVYFYNNAGNGSGEYKNYELSNTFNEDLVQLTFTYKLRATDDWIRDHATDTNAVDVPNYADIRDNLHDQPHWTADANVPYLPQHLTKEAVQVVDSNLLQFTLHVNPGGADLDKDKNYLIVSDKSENLWIDTESIKVSDFEGKELEQITNTAVGDNLKETEWVLLPSTEDGKFQLMVPDGVDLTITYNARIPEKGDNVRVSNGASIEGVTRSDSSYEGSLKVNSISGSGEAGTYKLAVEKYDSANSTKKLSGAEFKFYIVLSEHSKLEKTGDITVGEKTYQVHSEGDWNFTTGENGRFEFSDELLGPENYYILEETKAPEGYDRLAQPILFYYGVPDSTKTDPDGLIIPPGATLTVGNTATQFVMPETGGRGTTIFYVVGSILVIVAAILLISKKRTGDK